MTDVLLDALKDSAMVVPFLLIMFLLIEFIEQNTATSVKTAKFLQSRWSPLIGATVGLIPQCGFSVVATKLYSQRFISIGTLVAVFIATSDEAIPILISSPGAIHALLPLLLIKFVVGVIVGFLLDLIFRKKKTYVPVTEAVENNMDDGCCHHHIGGEDEHHSKVKDFIVHPLIHTAKIFAFILVINIAISVIIYYVGEERLAQVLLTDSMWQPLLATLIGLIPNCAASVLITELYVVGGLSLGSMVGALIVNAGIAYVILFKENRHLGDNLCIIGGMYILGSLLGILTNVII